MEFDKSLPMKTADNRTVKVGGTYYLGHRREKVTCVAINVKQRIWVYRAKDGNETSGKFSGRLIYASVDSFTRQDLAITRRQLKYKHQNLRRLLRELRKLHKTEKKLRASLQK